ncbi:MAG: TetR/AcrR family transcriptional regulator [Deltaproteobacteria bacterium]|nr:TetR/AcrR family transcriptional regulator [Deltaproteobacteria bacterium]
MARRAPPDRIARLIEVATEVFIRLGYRRTQMSDVAEALGVAKGTLYLAVESKEALFDLVVRHADAAHPPVPARLPVPTPARGATLAWVEERVGAVVIGPALAAALRAAPPRDARRELRGIVRELYATMSTQRVAIKLIDRCAADYPELAQVWVRAGRTTQLAALCRYLESRIAAGALAAVPDVPIAARIIIETLTTWAVHRHWDRAPQPMAEAHVLVSVEMFLVEALRPRRRREAAKGGAR